MGGFNARMGVSARHTRGQMCIHVGKDCRQCFLRARAHLRINDNIPRQPLLMKHLRLLAGYTVYVCTADSRGNAASTECTARYFNGTVPTTTVLHGILMGQ